MRIIYAAFIVLFSINAPVYADNLQDGLDAYEREDYISALKKLKPLAEEGDEEVQFLLGIIYAYGEGSVQDFEQALKWLNLSQANGWVHQEYLKLIYNRIDATVGSPKSFSGIWFKVKLWLDFFCSAPGNYTVSVLLKLPTLSHFFELSEKSFYKTPSKIISFVFWIIIAYLSFIFPSEKYDRIIICGIGLFFSYILLPTFAIWVVLIAIVAFIIASVSGMKPLGKVKNVLTGTLSETKNIEITPSMITPSLLGKFMVHSFMNGFNLTENKKNLDALDKLPDPLRELADTGFRIYLSWCFYLVAKDKFGEQFSDEMLLSANEAWITLGATEGEVASIFEYWFPILNDSYNNNKDAMIDGKEVPLVVFFAISFLGLDSSSPFYKQQAPDTQDVEWDIAQVLETAIGEARKYMLKFLENAESVSLLSDIKELINEKVDNEYPGKANENPEVEEGSPKRPADWQDNTEYFIRCEMGDSFHKYNNQQELMRALFDKFRDEYEVIEAYIWMEENNYIPQRKKTFFTSRRNFARRLYNEGIKDGWLKLKGERNPIDAMSTEEMLSLAEKELQKRPELFRNDFLSYLKKIIS